MGAPAAGSVVLVRFPFSDLSRSKLRPAVVLADAGRGDVILCQVTGKPYGDDLAVQIVASDLAEGSLSVTSFVRPGKIFTASEAIITRAVGRLTDDPTTRVRTAVVALLNPIERGGAGPIPDA